MSATSAPNAPPAAASAAASSSGGSAADELTSSSMTDGGARSASARLLSPLSSAPPLADGYAYALYPLSALGELSAAGVPRKVLHLIRHAQGWHNHAVAARGDEEEYKSEAWADSRLTTLGMAQAATLQGKLAGVALDVVLTSCLSRTIQTALLGVPAGPPFVALDILRERIGTHPCDRRRSRAALAADFPAVDFGDLATEEDDKWTPAREPWADVVRRAERFCALARARKEAAIAVTTHNDFLQGLLLMSRVALADEALRVTFANAEHLAVVLTWREAAAAAAPGADSSAGAAGPTPAPAAAPNS